METFNHVFLISGTQKQKGTIEKRFIKKMKSYQLTENLFRFRKSFMQKVRTAIFQKKSLVNTSCTGHAQNLC